MIRRTLLAVTLTTIVVLGATAPAFAQAGYAGATLTLTGSLLPGTQVEGQVLGCSANEVLTVTLVDGNGSRVLGTTTTDASGGARFDLALPTDITYPARLEVSGGVCGLVDSVSLPRPSTGTGAADLAHTGSDSTDLVGVGAACVAAGGVLVLAVRKRRRHAA